MLPSSEKYKIMFLYCQGNHLNLMLAEKTSGRKFEVHRRSIRLMKRVLFCDLVWMMHFHDEGDLYVKVKRMKIFPHYEY